MRLEPQEIVDRVCLGLALVLGLVGLVMEPGCAADDLEGQRPGLVEVCGGCSSDVDCQAGSSCDRKSWLCKRPEQYAQHAACDVECQTPAITVATGLISPCQYEGACVAVAGVCRPEIEFHCTDSWACAHEGRCKLQAGACVKG